MTLNDRLSKQLGFIIEADKLKRVLRQTNLIEDRSQENDAEHSWHLALMSLLLSEYSNAEHLDTMRVVMMVVIHDLVEIDAGDTFCYDYAAMKDKKQRELAAAERLFGLLPNDQQMEFRQIWDEFEERTTDEAKFAASMDRLQPLLLNFNTEGMAWQNHDVTRSQVVKRNETINEGSEVLWRFASWLIDEAVRRGFLREG